MPSSSVRGLVIPPPPRNRIFVDEISSFGEQRENDYGALYLQIVGSYASAQSLLPAFSRGTGTMYNHIIAAQRRSWSARPQLTSAASYLPGFSLARHGSTKQPASTWLSLLE
jgi:hypothetical protein